MCLQTGGGCLVEWFRSLYVDHMPNTNDVGSNSEAQSVQVFKHLPMTGCYTNHFVINVWGFTPIKSGSQAIAEELLNVMTTLQ